MTTRRLLIGVLAFPHASHGGSGIVAIRPVSLLTGQVVEARPDAVNPRVAVVRHEGKLYRLPMEYLAPVEKT
jgi:hypothetical protein